MESPNSLYSTNTINNNTSTNATTTTSKDGVGNGTFDSSTGDNFVIPSNFLISTKEIIARFPHNKRVGHYLLGRKLGEGSFAKVKEGLQTLTGQKVAIKVIDKKKAKEDAYVSKNMRREGKLLQMIIHPNIIQLYELMETENSYYLVTELCEGGDLMDYICARKYLTEACTRKFIRQIISAVDYLHRIGILHRDLKIENLLLDKNLNIKLIDFGLSNYTKSELCITQCGSPAYAAPELLAHKKYGCKVDVWSIGVNMYAMLTGNLPFTVEPFNIKSLYNKMMKNEMNAIPEHLSKSGEDLLRKLLNPDPVKRISLKEAMEHPWVNEGYASQLKPFPYPNKPSEDQINPTILRYMNSNMEFSVNEVTENIKSNKPSSSLATYYLLMNKVKTMLMKIEPKKTRTDTKQLTKEIKSSKPSVTPTTTTTTTTASTASPGGAQPVPTINPPNAQSPMPRAIKTPVSQTNNPNPGVSNNNTVTNGYNIAKSTQNKDMGGKSSERTHSPMPSTMTNQGPAAGGNQAPGNNLNGNNTINSTTSAFAGAIKTLTQKYKTMHLTTALDSNTTTTTTNNNNSSSANPSAGNNANNTAPSPNPPPPLPNTTTTNTSNNSANPTNFHYKTAYISHHHATNHHHPINLNTSLDQTFNNISIIGEQSSTNNSDNFVALDETANRHHARATNSGTSTLNLTNRNTPTPAKMSNQAEWTQLIKLPAKTKPSDVNNNDLSHHHMHPAADSPMHLNGGSNSSNSNNSSTNNNASTISPTFHMPILNPTAPYNNSNNSTNSTLNSTLMSNRSSKSPIVKKLSSPLTLPSIDAGRSTPQ